MSAAVGRLSEGKRSVGEVGKREKAARKPTRTTLINPQGISWPDPRDDDVPELMDVIKRSVQCLKNPLKKPPRSVVQDVPKAGRSKARKEWVGQNALKVGFDVARYITYRTSLCLGVNCVSRALDIDMLEAVVIEKNVNPEVITKMLVPIAVNKAVPILSVTGLSSLFEEMSDIRCLAVGLKKECATPTNHFFPLCQAVKKIYFKNFAVDDTEEINNESLTKEDLKSDSLRSSEETGTNSDALSTKANATEESLPARCRRLSLTIDQEMDVVRQVGLSSQSHENSRVQKRNSKKENAQKPFVPAKVRKVTLQ